MRDDDDTYRPGGTTCDIVTASTIDDLLLGRFHMANPGRDLIDLEVDDVLTPQRQRLRQRTHPDPSALVETSTSHHLVDVLRYVA